MSEKADPGSIPPARDSRWVLLALIALIGVRVAFPPPAGWSRDWILIVGVGLLCHSFVSGPRVRSTILLATMAFLLGTYIHGQLGHVLATLGWAP
jgi:hypothetical protein